MKRFITYISMQGENLLKKVKYEPVDGVGLTVERETYFPVSLLVDNYAEENEEIELICLKERDNPDIDRNYGILKDEISEILSGRNCKCNYKVIELNAEENIDNHLHAFAEIIACVEDGDTIHSCVTFGTKPIPIIEMMALDYAYRVKKDVTIGSVVYGKLDRRDPENTSAKIYDITALFFMSQIVGHLAEMKTAEPEKMIRKVLGLGDDV